MKMFKGKGNGKMMADALNGNFAELANCKARPGTFASGDAQGGIGFSSTQPLRMLVAYQDIQGGGWPGCPGVTSMASVVDGAAAIFSDRALEYPSGGSPAPPGVLVPVSAGLYDKFIPKGTLFLACFLSGVEHGTEIGGDAFGSWVPVAGGAVYIEGRSNALAAAGSSTVDVTMGDGAVVKNIWDQNIVLEDVKVVSLEDVESNTLIGCHWVPQGKYWRGIWSGCES